MRARSHAAGAVLLAALAGRAAGSAPAAPRPDPSAAEAMYRIAQRLAAEGDSGAKAAFEKTVALDPSGALADDAWIGIARLSRVPDWPEDLGALDADRASSAAAALGKVLEASSPGDRAPEARTLLALIRLAPLPGRDPERARQDLIAVAGGDRSTTWSSRARYALGVLDAWSGEPARAAGAFARIALEDPESDAAPRARLGFARALLAESRFDDAAAALSGILGAADRPPEARAWLDLALRAIARAQTPGAKWSAATGPLPVVATAKGAALLAEAPGGRLALWDRKAGALLRAPAGSAPAPSVPLEDVTALAFDPFGRLYAATRDRLVRVEARGPVTVSKLDDFGGAAAIAVDASGSVWLADRRGDRIGVAAPGGAPRIVREARGAGVAALLATGRGVIAAESKSGRLVAIDASGSERGFSTTVFRRPTAMASDAAGEIAVLDEKAESVTLLSPDGAMRDTLSTATAGVSRPIAIAFEDDGTLLILDESSGQVVGAP